MKNWGSFKGLVAIIAVAGIAVVMGMVIGSSITHNDLSAEEKPIKNFDGSLAYPYLNTGSGHSPFVEVAEKVKPAVVNISAKSMVKDNYHNFLNDDIWRQFFGLPQRPNQPKMRPVESLGSGFFISPDGYILTNNHVVQGADDVVVRLSNTEEYKATVIGADSETDVALIKIDAKGEMPYVDFGNSDSILVGDWAIAVGNPFPQLGLNRTVTVGVISALGRSGLTFGQENPVYQNYIQTDASINPGNSGGPLVDIHGRVVGINSAIVTPSGGNVGIGFAVPINLALKIADELRSTGKISRGWLGILPEAIDENMAQALNLKNTNGVLVGSVESDSPAEKGGLKVGDVILDVDGKEVKDVQDFRFMIAEAGPDKKIEMKVDREGKIKNMDFTLGNREEYLTKSSSGGEQMPESGWLGLQVSTFTQADANQMGINFVPAVIIDSVEPASAADDAGLFAGDLILEIDHVKIENKSDFNNVASKLKDRKKAILFMIQRQNQTLLKAVKPGE